MALMESAAMVRVRAGLATAVAEMASVEADSATEAKGSEAGVGVELAVVAQPAEAVGGTAAVARQAEAAVAKRAGVKVGTAAVAQLAAWVEDSAGAEVKVVRVEAKAAATPSP